MKLILKTKIKIIIIMNLLIITPVMCMTMEVLNSLKMQVQEVEDGINHLEENIKANNNDNLMQNAIRRELLDAIESLYEQSIVIRKNFNPIPLIKQKIEDLNKSIRNYICQRKNICDIDPTELPEVLKIIKNSNNLNKQGLAKIIINKKNTMLINMITKAENIKNLDVKKENYENIEALKDLISNFGLILEKAKSYNTEDYDEMINLMIVSFKSFYENDLGIENEYFIQNLEKNNYEKDKKTGEVIFKNGSIENENNLLDGNENIYSETPYKDFGGSMPIKSKGTELNIEKSDSQKESWLKLKNEQKSVSPEIKLAIELDKQNNTISKGFPSLLSYIMSKDLLGLNNNKTNLSSNLIEGNNEINFEIKELLINTNNSSVNNKNLLESDNNFKNMPNYLSQSKIVNEGRSKIEDLEKLENNKNEIKNEKNMEMLIENKHNEIEKDLTIALENIDPKSIEEQKKQIIGKNLVMDSPGIHSLKSFETNAKGDIIKSTEKIDLPYPIDYDTSILAKPFDPDTNKPLADEIDFAAEILSVPLNPITKKPMRNDPEINAVVEKPPINSKDISDQIITVDPVTGLLVKKTPIVSNAPLTETDPITLKPLPKNQDAIEAALSPIPESPVVQQVKNDLIKESLIHSSILSASGKAVPSIQSIYKKFQSSHDNQILKSKIETDLKNKFNMI